MNPLRVRLDNARRNAMLQRAQLRGSVAKAKGTLAPKSLIERGKYRVGEKVDSAVNSAEAGLREYRVPIALAAMAGLAYAFRDPLRRAMPYVAEKLGGLADQAIDLAKTAVGAEVDQHIAEEDDEITE